MEALPALLVLCISGRSADRATLPEHEARGMEQSLQRVRGVREKESESGGGLCWVHEGSAGPCREAQEVPLLYVGVVVLELLV